MRQRTKEHVEFLEEYIKFLESGVEKLQEGMRSENIDSVLKKNQELEDENRMLRGQLALRMSEFSSHWVSAPNNPPQPFPVSTYTNQIYHPTRAYAALAVSLPLLCLPVPSQSFLILFRDNFRLSFPFLA
jgi:hypothetical protein